MITLLLQFFTALGAALICSLALTPIARHFLKKFGVVDMPSARRVNKTPIPRGGGVAVVITVLCLTPAMYYLFPTLSPNFSDYALPFVVGSVVLTTLGFCDDVKGLSPRFRLIVQILIAIFFWMCDLRFVLPTSIFGAWVLSPWVTLPLTIGWYVIIINAFNLIDGLDGLASGLAIVAQLGICGAAIMTHSSYTLLLPTAIMVGALLGFLRYNYNPASIFLGDSGSLFIGASIASAALISRGQDTALLMLVVPIMCIGLPVADTSLAILRRTVRTLLARQSGSNEMSAVMTADKDHLHHRILRYFGGQQRISVWLMYGIAIVLVVVGFGIMSLRNGQTSFFILGALAFGYALLRLMSNVELFNIGQILNKPVNYTGRRRITPLIYVFADWIAFILSFIFTRLLFPISSTAIKGADSIRLILAFGVPVFIALVSTHCYSRLWGRSTRKDSAILVFAVVAGSIVSQLILSYMTAEWGHHLRRLHCGWTIIVVFPLFFIRYAKTVFLQFLSYAENRHLKQCSRYDTSIQRVLFYGSGINLRAYITFFEANVTRNKVSLAGILDDNPGLRGSIFRDVPILGPFEVLEDEALFAKIAPTRIIITSPAITSNVERTNEIKAFCRTHNISLSTFSVAETFLVRREVDDA